MSKWPLIGALVSASTLGINLAFKPFQPHTDNTFNFTQVGFRFKNKDEAYSFINNDSNYDHTFDSRARWFIDGADSAYFNGFDFSNETTSKFFTKSEINSMFFDRLKALTNTSKVYVSKDATETGFVGEDNFGPYFNDLAAKDKVTSVANYYAGLNGADVVPFDDINDAFTSITSSIPGISYQGHLTTSIGDYDTINDIFTGMMGYIVSSKGYKIAPSVNTSWISGAQYIYSDGEAAGLIDPSTVFTSLTLAKQAAKAVAVAKEKSKVGAETYTYRPSVDWDNNRFNDNDYTNKKNSWITTNTAAAYNKAIRWTNMNSTLATIGFSYATHGVFQGTNWAPPTWKTAPANARKLRGTSQANSATDSILKEAFIYNSEAIQRAECTSTYFSSVPFKQYEGVRNFFKLGDYMKDGADRRDFSDIRTYCLNGMDGSKPDLTKLQGLISGEDFSEGKSVYDRIFYDGVALPSITPDETDYRDSSQYTIDFTSWANAATQTNRVLWDGALYNSNSDTTLNSDIEALVDKRLTDGYFSSVGAVKYSVTNFNEAGHAISPATLYDTDAKAKQALAAAIKAWAPWTTATAYSTVANNPYELTISGVTKETIIELMSVQFATKNLKLASSTLLTDTPNIKWHDILEFLPLQYTLVPNLNDKGIDYFLPQISNTVARVLLENKEAGLEIKGEAFVQGTDKRYFLKPKTDENGIYTISPVYAGSIEELKQYWKEVLDEN